jgi:hypothetical protein
MADFYPYLIASLPMLHFGMRPPFSFEQFLELCRPLMPGRHFHLLRSLPSPDQYAESLPGYRVIQKWVEFDVALRNELVRMRATRKHQEPAKYLRGGGYGSSSLSSAITAAMNAPILEAEQILDETRWKKLDELATGHYFDLDHLIIYAYKLSILQRWENIRNADGAILLKRALQH